MYTKSHTFNNFKLIQCVNRNENKTYESKKKKLIQKEKFN